eukprot:TRINITY_DN5089_c0_g1_i1.p1 TRINITY_DN5089_c0_g1~~TRINITY_DN5089_c0_g1_i1.p1  ORF type:complete len:679 (+),score=117.83 TRINITY_DN5089_c0_g1_i1:42-2078(+)
MATQLRATFEAKKAEHRPVFVPFITAGFPTLQDTVPVLLGLEAGGADVIELGIPHTDPLADGPTIQQSGNVALENGASLGYSLEQVKEARAKGLKVPVVLMGYYNPFGAYGEKRLVEAAKAAGVNGFIVVDLPPEESKEFREYCKEADLSYIPLIAPTTSDARLRYIEKIADSFVYCVSALGVTGARTTISQDLEPLIQRVRKSLSWPIAIGFGVSTREHLNGIAQLGEGVVVGSKVVTVVGEAPAGERGEAARTLVEYFTKESTTDLHKKERAKLDDTLEEVAKERLPAMFGQFGGRFAPESLHAALDELEDAYIKIKDDPDFKKEPESYYNYIGRPTPLFFADRLTEICGGAEIWLKREDLAHTGAHKINNAIGQALLAKRLGKPRIIAETGAGQHGVATATVCAKLGLECVVYMGTEDIQRQSLNVFRMKMLGATVVPVDSGSKTLKDAINEAMRDWVTNIRTTHYLVGSAIGPHPFPTIVRDFQSVIGREAKGQFVARNGVLPDAVVACVGGGSNAIGMFYEFIQEKEVQIVGVEAAGHGLDSVDKHCATCVKGTIGVLHGTRTLLLQDPDGQIKGTHSLSAGLDYPGVGPEHAWLYPTGCGKYVRVPDSGAVEGFTAMTKNEGIIPALESSHAIYYAMQMAKGMRKDQRICVCLSGRGDKDMHTVAQEFGVTL